MPSRSKLDDHILLKGLTNIGPTIAARLAVAGIRTVGDLRHAGGPAAVYKKLKAKNPDAIFPVCYYLYSLQGALEGRHWDNLSAKQKQMLLHQIQ